MNALPGPSEMPIDWFRRMLSHPPAHLPRQYLYDPEGVAHWHAQLRHYAQALWAEAWMAGAAWQDAHARPPVIMQMPLTREAEQAVEEFRRRLEGLPDAPPEG